MYTKSNTDKDMSENEESLLFGSEDLLFSKKESEKEEKIEETCKIRDLHIIHKSKGYNDILMVSKGNHDALNLLLGVLKTKNISDIEICSMLCEFANSNQEMLCWVRQVISSLL